MELDSGDSFGFDVDTNGDYAIIGANGVNNNKGSAFIYSKTEAGWEHAQNLFPMDFDPDTADISSFFGESVAISADWAIVGAPRDNNSTEPRDSIEEANSGSAFSPNPSSPPA